MSRSPFRPTVVSAPRTTVREVDDAPAEASAPAHAAHAPESEAPARYSVALLRIALWMKQEDGPELEDAIQRVAARMDLDAGALRAWIAQNTGLLREDARAHLRLQHPMD